MTYTVRISMTEILDVAPIDLLNGMTKSLLDSVSPEFIPADVKIKTLDIGFHWVSETGQGTSCLTSGMSIVPTVCTSHNYAISMRDYSMQLIGASEWADRGTPEPKRTPS